MEENKQKRDQIEEHSYPRWIVVGVFLFSFLVIVFWGWQMKARLTLNIPTFSEGELSLEHTQSLLDADDVQLKKQDSDEDGLSDYLELRVYGTNPFIADSDSDGIIDSEEITAGKNPLCPEGKDCFIYESTQNTNYSQESGGDVESVFNSDFMEQIANSLEDPDLLRQYLIDGGADPVLVKHIDDQTIQLIAQEALRDISGPTDEKIELIQDLSAQEIRNLLANFGMEPEVLDNMTDEELILTYQQTLLLLQTQGEQ